LSNIEKSPVGDFFVAIPTLTQVLSPARGHDYSFGIHESWLSNIEKSPVGDFFVAIPTLTQVLSPTRGHDYSFGIHESWLSNIKKRPSGLFFASTGLSPRFLAPHYFCLLADAVYCGYAAFSAALFMRGGYINKAFYNRKNN